MIVEESENEKERAISFSEEELKQMPKAFRKKFKIGKFIAHVRKRGSGVYEIRIQINGVRISAYGKELSVAREKFIQKLRQFDTTFPCPPAKKVVFLEEYARIWLESIRRPHVIEKTYAAYVDVWEKYIFPVIGGWPISQIGALDLQKIINTQLDLNHERTAKKIFQQIHALFLFAENDGVIERSPVSNMKSPYYEADEVVPLNREEEKALVDALLSDPKNVFRQAFVFLMYTGMRSCELANARIEGDWIICQTAKSPRGHKKKLRSIPISPMLKRVLCYIDLDQIRQKSTISLSHAFARYVPGHHKMHGLRHTFTTRAQECKIPREFVSVWDGHVADNSTTTKVYTHLQHNLEAQLEEIRKFDYPL